MNKIYDVAIIGGGLSGLLMAHLCARRGYTVVLCEAQDQVGGRCRIDTPKESMQVPYGFNIHLFTKELCQALELDFDLIDLKNLPPQTFQHKAWRDVASEELSPEQKFYDLKNFNIVWDLLKIELPDTVHVETSQPIGDSRIESSLLMEVSNSQKKWQAKAFVMACLSKDMLNIIPKENFHKKFLNAYNKQESVSAVKLDFITDRRFCELQNVLMSLDPVGVGIIASNFSNQFVPKGYELSQWLFFLTPEELLDKEETAKKIRAGKRFMKKAFDGFLEHIVWERIAVLPHVFSQHPMELSEEWTALKNLFWVSDELGLPNETGNPAIRNILPTFEKLDRFLKTSF